MKYKENDIKTAFIHYNVVVMDIPIHVVEAGPISKAAVFFIHGWPACWLEFKTVMAVLSDDYHVVAVDLPGIDALLKTKKIISH